MEFICWKASGHRVRGQEVRDAGKGLTRFVDVIYERKGPGASFWEKFEKDVGDAQWMRCGSLSDEDLIQVDRILAEKEIPPAERKAV